MLHVRKRKFPENEQFWKKNQQRFKHSKSYGTTTVFLFFDLHFKVKCLIFYYIIIIIIIIIIIKFRPPAQSL